MQFVPRDSSGIAALVSGPEDGRPVICLHGFPDIPHSWEPVAERLAGRGFRVVAPYLPGYAPSSLEGAFDMASVATRMAPYLRAIGKGSPVDVIGHDWGAVLAHALTHWQPTLVRKVVNLAVPHLGAFESNILRNPGQFLRSSYMGLFQLGTLAERCVKLGNYALLRQLWRTWSPNYAPPEAHFSQLTHCLSQSLPAPLMYYRAYTTDSQARKRMRELALSPTKAPLLHIHGRNDGCIGVELTANQQRHFAGPFEQRIIDDAGHFVHLERPDEVATAASAWLER